MGLPQNLGRLAAGLTADASLNIGVGVTPSGTYKFEVGTTSKFTGVATFGSTLSNGTYTYTLPSATGTLALTSALSGYLPLTGGTLTGALGGTSATFSTTLAANNSVGLINLSATGYGTYVRGGNSSNYALYVTDYNAGTAILDANLTRVALGVPLTGTSATFSSSVTARNGSSGTAFVTTNAVDADFTIETVSGGTTKIGTSGNRLAINSGGGNVGIGTSNPLTILHINSPASTNATIYFGVNGTMNGYLGQSASSGSLSNGAAVGDIVLRSQTNLLFTSGGDGERMRIASGGNVLIGTTTDNGQKLQVNGNLSVSTSNTIFAYTQSGGFNAIQIQNVSNNTSARAIEFRGWNNSTTGGIDTYVNLTTYNTSSDYRLKEDLKDFYGLEMVSKLKMYDFKWKEADWRMYGGLAHQIAEVVPYAVSGEKDAVDKEGNVKSQGVDYSTLVPVLVKAVQELSTQIKELQSQINK